MNNRVQELFHDVVDLTADERGRYFAQHSVDEESRGEVEALLRFDSDASGALERDIGQAASLALTQIEARARQRCGPYRLLDIVGRGGMGAVYLAERVDGEVTQRVAIKLLGPGSSDPESRQRFLQERQILASLAHPNIARLLDAGHIDDGQPFLAMEYVEGRPIDVFVSGLGVRQKITLFLKVCAAVGYLHRYLVVHRDLKPSNILVTGEGEPKLLDFGIAKILDLSTDSTLTGMRMLTPDYASPEQVTGARVSTATDIYSLGAVLYRLLTGKAPHEFEDRSPEAIAAAIITREVTRPGKWAPELKGDLESILLKSLRKDPQARYSTVEQFSDDLNAFLESRPVRARAGNAWYHGLKFLRRYWAPLIATALVVASLSAGLFVANRQRVIAERRFAQLRQFSKGVLDVDREMGGLPGTLKARGKLVSTLIQYLGGLAGEALHDNALALEAGDAYVRVARIQGVPAWNTLGQFAEADESLRKGEMVTDPVLVNDPRNREGLYVSANIAHDRALVAGVLRKPELAVAEATKVVSRFDQMFRLGNPTLKEVNAATYIYGDLAELLIALDRFNDAARYARLGIEVSRTQPGIPGPRAQAFNMLAGALMDLGDFPGALEALREARNLLTTMRDLDAHFDERYYRMILYQLHWREGLMLGEDGGVNLNRLPEAEEAFRQAFEIVEEFAKPPNNLDLQIRFFVASAGRHLGNSMRQRDPRRALAIYDHSLMRIREVDDVNHDLVARREEAFLLAASSYAARWAHREDDARKRIDAAFRLLRDTKDYPAEKISPGQEADAAVRALADHYAESGQPGKAVEAYQELRRQIMASNPDPEHDLLNATRISQLDVTLAALLRRVGRTDDAATLDVGRLAIWQQWAHKLPNNPFVLRQLAAKPAQ